MSAKLVGMTSGSNIEERVAIEDIVRKNIWKKKYGGEDLIVVVFKNKTGDYEAFMSSLEHLDRNIKNLESWGHIVWVYPSGGFPNPKMNEAAIKAIQDFEKASSI